jgi:mono/diheme cytochrome c family protein
MIFTTWLIALLAWFHVDPAQSALVSGEQHYRSSCAACHGPDGRGRQLNLAGEADMPLPDFTDCAFSTPEPDADWFAVVHQGGPARAFDSRMPAFGEALSELEIRQTLAYIRTLCRDTRWPRGELNLPRPLVTEKAFPENEAVLSVSFTGGDAGAVENEFLYEQRLGARSQFEVAIPVAIQKTGGDEWRTGIGDAVVAFKHVLFSSLDSGTILSAAAELTFPTGNEDRGFGNGVSVLEPFVAIGRILPGDGFVQFQGGVAIPWSSDGGDTEVFWRSAVGRSFTQNRFGRSWAPMAEVLGARQFKDDGGVQWDVVPQMQVSLSRRQHIMVNAGVRIPLTDRNARHTQALMYVLWDWFDGGLFDGWR